MARTEGSRGRSGKRTEARGEASTTDAGDDGKYAATDATTDAATDATTGDDAARNVTRATFFATWKSHASPIGTIIKYATTGDGRSTTGDDGTDDA